MGILSDTNPQYNLDLPNLFNVLQNTYWKNTGNEKS